MCLRLPGCKLVDVPVSVFVYLIDAIVGYGLAINVFFYTILISARLDVEATAIGVPHRVVVVYLFNP